VPKPKRSYVYAIHVDGVLRYIGKGSNGRMYSHMKEVKQRLMRKFHLKNISPLFQQKLTEAVMQGAVVEEIVLIDNLTPKQARDRVVSPPHDSCQLSTDSMSNNLMPVAVTDEQLSMIYRAAEPLLPPDRLAFLAALADRLRGEPIVGDGSIARAIRELQRQCFRPPRGELHAPKINIRDPGPAIGRGETL
jgi:hypothetical protein